MNSCFSRHSTEPMVGDSTTGSKECFVKFFVIGNNSS